MHFSLFLLCSAAATALAQAGTNCNIVANRTVVAGDNLANIGTETNTTVAQLQFVNTQIANPRLINVGDVIKIPNSKCVAPAQAPLAEPTATCSNGTAATTKVVAGDTFIIIAKEKLGITLPALLAANPQVADINVVNVGDVLNIPLCKNGAAAGGAQNGTASAAPAKSASPTKSAKPAKSASPSTGAGVGATVPTTSAAAAKKSAASANASVSATATQSAKAKATGAKLRRRW